MFISAYNGTNKPRYIYRVVNTLFVIAIGATTW
jgi:hypothetical protein